LNQNQSSYQSSNPHQKHFQKLGANRNAKQSAQKRTAKKVSLNIFIFNFQKKKKKKKIIIK